MRRREFIALLGSAMVARPIAASAQPVAGMRRIGFLSALADDAVSQARTKALLQGLRDLGWTEGHNFHIDYRFAAGDPSMISSHVAELIGLAPDVIVAVNSPVVAALKQATSAIPIVAVSVADLVQQGFVANLARPGGNITGFSAYEPNLIVKMIERLKEMVPGLVRAAVIFNPQTGAFMSNYLRSSQPQDYPTGIAVTPASVLTVEDTETLIAELGHQPNSGLIIPSEAFTIIHRGLIIRLAAKHRVPAIYTYRSFVADGGLMSYGPDQYDLFRRSATYVDLILKGARPADLPVQTPTKFELAINLKAAKALGLTVPLSMQQLADEAIE
jgi:putative ABC transport system substrate-binding protein